MDSLFQEINQTIYTQDVIIVSAFPKDIHLIGECNNPYSDVDSQLVRACLLIDKLINKAAKIHREANFYNPENVGLVGDQRYKNTAFKSGHENHITRLTTNEFMFYTKKRLEPDEFSKLFEEILTLATKQPENLHIVLSSFAVKTLDNKTMNVAAFVECGQKPKVHFIVKNGVSDIDPVYYGENQGKKRIEFLNVDMEVDSEKTFPTLNIHGKEYTFSYNNVFEVSTLGGAKKIEVIEICLDHLGGVGKKNCELYMVNALLAPAPSLLPIQISQVVTSNTLDLVREHMLETNLTHVDPRYSEEHLLKKSRLVSSKTLKSALFFGTPQSEMYVTTSIRCSPLPFEILSEVEKHNQEIVSGKKRKREDLLQTSNKKPKL